MLHIGFNMLALYFLGPMLENVLGRVAVPGALPRLRHRRLGRGDAVLGYPYSQTLGASGAIFGLMGALAVVALKVRGQTQSVLIWIG